MKCCIAFLLLCCSAATYALISFGSCPAKSGVSNFDIARFSGFWYENRALENIHLTQEGWGSCETIMFDYTSKSSVTLNDNRNIFDFVSGNSNTASTNYTRVKTTISTLVFGTNYTGAIYADFPLNAAEFKIHGSWRFLSTPAKSIQVLDTNYNEYALLWSCTNMGNLLNKQNAWILTRTQNITSQQSSTIINNLFAQGLSDSAFTVTDQSNCAARTSRKPFFSPLALSQVKAGSANTGDAVA